MSKIYNIIDENGNQIQLVSKEYVDTQLRAIREALLAHERDEQTAHKEGSRYLTENAASLDSVKEVDLPIVQHLPEFKAEDIEQDSNHRFVTDAQINIFKKKPSVLEMENALSNISAELKTIFNNQYANLLNFPDIVQRLRDASGILADTENNLYAHILELLEGRTSDVEFEEHLASDIHLDDNDRNALNALIGYIKDGSMDKIASIGESAKQADIADRAKTLEGWTLDHILWSGLANEVVYDGHGPRSVECFPSGSSAQEFLVYNIINENGIEAFKPGTYGFEAPVKLRVPSEKEVVIQGAGYGTVFIMTEAETSHITIKDLIIDASIGNKVNFHVYDKCRFEGCKFKHCNITFHAADMTYINGCIFEDCTINFNPETGNMMVVNNFFQHCHYLKPLNTTIIWSNNMDLI